MTTDPLSSQEKFAALVVADAVGARAEAHDVQGRQGAVDVLLTYPDGREAALEVTSQAGAGVQQRNALTRDEVPNPGNWTWHIAIGNVRDLPELLERYARIIATSEALEISHPSRLYTRDLPSPDFEWLMESSVTMSGLPDVPARGRPNRQWIRILPQADGGGVDETLSGLPETVAEILTLPNQLRHVEKLRASGLGETHLFVALDEGALPFAQGLHLLASRLDYQPMGSFFQTGLLSSGSSPTSHTRCTATDMASGAFTPSTRCRLPNAGQADPGNAG